MRSILALVLICGVVLAVDLPPLNPAFSAVAPGTSFRKFTNFSSCVPASALCTLATASVAGFAGVKVTKTATGLNYGSIIFAEEQIRNMAPGIFFAIAGGSVSALPNPDATSLNAQIAGGSFAAFTRPRAVFEYLDNDGEAGYQKIPSNVGATPDKMTGIYFLANASYLPLTQKYHRVNDTVNNVVFNVVSTASETVDNVFKLRFTVSDRNTQLGSKTLSPDNTKIDMQIRYFDNPSFTSPIVEAYNGVCRIVSVGPSSYIVNNNVNPTGKTRGTFINEEFTRLNNAGNFCPTTLVGAVSVGAWIDSIFGTAHATNAKISVYSSFGARAAKTAGSLNFIRPAASASMAQINVGNYHANFSWDTTASTVSLDGLTVNSINVHSSVSAYVPCVADMTKCDESTNLMVLAGWTIDQHVFNFDAIHPSIIQWDPTFGGADSSTNLYTSGASAFAVPTFLSAAFSLSVLVALLF